MKNFIHEKHTSEIVYNEVLGSEQPLVINLESSYDMMNRNHNRIHLDMDDIFISRGKVYLRRVDLALAPADSNHMVVTRSAHSYGKSERLAKENLNKVNHTVRIDTNKVSITDYIKLNQGDRYRMQSYNYRIKIPLGTEVIFKGDRDMIPKRSIKRGEQVRLSNIYVMTEDGLAAKELVGDNI